MALGDRIDVNIGENTFHIMMFEPFRAMEVLGDLQKVFSPIIGKLAGGIAKNTEVLDVEVNDISGMMPALEGAFASLAEHVDGKTLKNVCSMLLNETYISVDDETGRAKALTTGMVNKVFVGKTGEMTKLMWEVIKVNYSDFFTTFSTQFGNLGAFTTKK